MNVKQIVDFLNEKRGYVKEGKNRLKRILNSKGFKVTLNDCEEALFIVRKQIREEKEFRSETGFNQNYVHVDNDDKVEILPISDIPSNMKIKKAWMGANGKMLYSYEADKTQPQNDAYNFKYNLLEDIKTIVKVDTRNYVKHETSPYVLEVSLPDLHFGKGNTEELKKNFFEALVNITSKCESLPIKEIILPIGNDGMNSEGMRASTTKGTPQQDTLPWFDSFRVYYKTLIEAIDYLSQIAPVRVVVVQGNHDYERMFYIGELLLAYYDAKYSKQTAPRVMVDNNEHPRKFVHFDNVLIMYTHGDNEKHSELPIIMATEKPVEFALSKHRETHCGHFHKEMILDEARGIKTRFMPSICAQDEWHKKMGYESYRAAQGILWHGERGIEAILQYNV